LEEIKMTRKKTLKKPKSYKKNISSLKKFDPTKHLKKMTKKDLVNTLATCLSEGDADSFKEVLWAYVDTRNKSDIARKMKISRSTLYHMVSEEGNPTLDVIAKLIGTISA
jgi:probable addiction module antidote protein